jgi:UDP-N-acetylmuramate dehydrogenase
MRLDHDVPFTSLTTLRLGGPATELLTAESIDDISEVVHKHHRHGFLTIGGGSNLVVADGGVDTPVLRIATAGVEVSASDGGVEVLLAAGENWDEFVERSVLEGWSGVEALSGIPGLVGATPIQNVGAYGQEVSDVCVSVDVIECKTGSRLTLDKAECQFGYRSSSFKTHQGRYVVTGVRLRLSAATLSQPIRYAELAARLGIAVGESAPLREVRDAVLHLRRSKGMVLDDNDYDTWSAGSFFTNPVLDGSAGLPPEAPQWPQADGRVKTSAAWLIEHAGFERGFGDQVGRGAVTLSTKHTLALTNRGEGTTTELLELAALIRGRVHDQFGVALESEPTLVGVTL